MNLRLHTDPPATSDRGVLWLAVAVATLGVVVLSLVGYLIHRAELADERTGRQRAAICGILANIPGQVPAAIAKARSTFARPGHPDDCQPIRHPQVRALPTPTPTSTPAPATTVLIVPAPTTTSGPQPRHTRRSTPSQHLTHPPSPPPSPGPTPTCSLRHPLKCL